RRDVPDADSRPLRRGQVDEYARGRLTEREPRVRRVDEPRVAEREGCVGVIDEANGGDARDLGEVVVIAASGNHQRERADGDMRRSEHHDLAMERKYDVQQPCTVKTRSGFVPAAGGPTITVEFCPSGNAIRPASKTTETGSAKEICAESIGTLTKALAAPKSTNGVIATPLRCISNGAATE